MSKHNENEQYGVEWERAVMRLDKATLVRMLRMVCKQRDARPQPQSSMSTSRGDK
jgi:hypothetical protein